MKKFEFNFMCPRCWVCRNWCRDDNTCVTKNCRHDLTETIEEYRRDYNSMRPAILVGVAVVLAILVGLVVIHVW